MMRAYDYNIMKLSGVAGIPVLGPENSKSLYDVEYRGLSIMVDEYQNMHIYNSKKQDIFHCNLVTDIIQFKDLCWLLICMEPVPEK